MNDLSVTYGKVLALSSVNLDVQAGSVTAVIGPSGCGKSTFLCCLNRLSDIVPGCCVSGQVILDAQDIFAPEVDVISLRRKVGIIFQRPNPFPTSIWRNLEMPLRLSGVRDRHEIEYAIEDCLQIAGLWNEVRDRLRQPALALSGGQQQRLCIARALTLKPKAFQLDEPCSALDPIAAGVVEDLIAEFRGIYTTVIITHNLAQARRVGTEVAVFWAQNGPGRLIEYGAVDEIFSVPKHDLTRLYVSGRVA